MKRSWIVGNNKVDIHTSDKDFTPVATVMDRHNANLVAAAPDLFEALALAQVDLATAANVFEAQNQPAIAEEFRGKVRSLNAVIAKARGAK